MQDGRLRGVRVGGRTIKLSQFADDTQFFLEGYEDLKRMWKIIEKYEAATGMRANKQKIIALRLGKTRREAIPSTTETRMIKFVSGRDRMTLLGIPFSLQSGRMNSTTQNSSSNCTTKSNAR